MKPLTARGAASGNMSSLTHSSMHGNNVAPRPLHVLPSQCIVDKRILLAICRTKWFGKQTDDLTIPPFLITGRSKIFLN
eukprot:1633774-Amphidinium_carterae.1